MNMLPIFIIGLCVSVDAFGVSVSNGMLIPKINMKTALKFGIIFGFFQLIMPLIGFALCLKLGQSMLWIDHWLAFFILTCIGGKMVLESINGKKENINDSVNITSMKNMMVLGFATSIDALAVGVSFALMGVDIIKAIAIIGVITLATCTLGAYLGSKIGGVFKKSAERAGGIILILIGVKILIEHLRLF